MKNLEQQQGLLGEAARRGLMTGLTPTLQRLLAHGSHLSLYLLFKQSKRTELEYTHCQTVSMLCVFFKTGEYLSVASK